MGILMSFLTGQDWTPKFAGQVLPDRSESGIIFFAFYQRNKQQQNYEQKFEKKIWIFFIFKSPVSGKRPVSEQSGF